MVVHLILWFFLFQWVFVEQACNMFSLTIVPLYDTLGLDSCVFIINQGKKLIYYHKLIIYNSVNDTYFNGWFCRGEDTITNKSSW